MKAKRLLIGLVLAVMPIVTMADGKLSNKPLPETISTFLTSHFADIKVAFHKEKNRLSDERYNIHLMNGIDIEMDRNGNWTEIDGHKNALPSSVIPEKIQRFISENYPNQTVFSLDRKDRGRIEVKLSNGWELLFDKNFQLINIDD